MNVLMVGGVFNNEGGRASGYFNKLTQAINEWIPRHSRDIDVAITVINGGTYESLKMSIDQVPGVTHLLWFADVPNDLPKLVPGLREKNPDMVLFISKNNRLGKYTRDDLHGRMVAADAQYLVEFTESRYIHNQLDATVHDVTMDQPHIKNETAIGGIADCISKLIVTVPAHA